MKQAMPLLNTAATIAPSRPQRGIPNLTRLAERWPILAWPHHPLAPSVRRMNSIDILGCGSPHTGHRAKSVLLQSGSLGLCDRSCSRILGSSLSIHKTRCIATWLQPSHSPTARRFSRRSSRDSSRLVAIRGLLLQCTVHRRSTRFRRSSRSAIAPASAACSRTVLTAPRRTGSDSA